MIFSKDFTDIMKLLSDPFQVDPTGAAVKYQMELTVLCWCAVKQLLTHSLTDIQNDSDLKRAFSEQDLLSFDSSHVSSDSYNNLLHVLTI